MTISLSNQNTAIFVAYPACNHFKINTGFNSVAHKIMSQGMMMKMRQFCFAASVYHRFFSGFNRNNAFVKIGQIFYRAFVPKNSA